VDCEERERLIEIHRDAVAKYNQVQKSYKEACRNPGGAGWRKEWYGAVNKGRLICRKTLEDLNRHRAAHGC